MDYVDIDTVHAYGGFQNPTEEDDAILEHLISTASKMVDDFCGRIFAIATGAATTARTFTDDNGLWPYYSKTLWLDDDLCSTPTYAETPAPTVTYIPRSTPYNRIVRDDGDYWPDPTTVTGHWAYSLTPPMTIVQATLRLVMWMYRQRESTDGDRPIIANGMVIMPNALPKDVTALLAPYARVKLP